MKQLSADYLGHVTINQRIYEIHICCFGTEKEQLFINDMIFKEFTGQEQEDGRHKRSIRIENTMVHFYCILGEISVELDEGRSAVEHSAVPHFPILSDKVASEYCVGMAQGEETVRGILSPSLILVFLLLTLFGSQIWGESSSLILTILFLTLSAIYERLLSTLKS